MIKVMIKDINVTEYSHFPSPLQCFLLENLDCNGDCLGHPTVSVTFTHETD